MISFSSITAEEFFRLNASTIPDEFLKYFDELSEQVKELQKEVQVLQRNDELAWEQVGFAKDLIEQLDNFAENNLSKPKLQMYNYLRENSYFEV